MSVLFSRMLLPHSVTLAHRVFAPRKCAVAAASLSASSRMGWDCALTNGLALRSFSHTVGRFGCGAGILQRSGPCFGGLGTSGHGRRRDAGHRALRLYGTVTAFKHRRGYGFVLAEGIAAAAHLHKQTYVPLESQAAVKNTMGLTSEQEEACKDLPKSFFFTRAALHGGFYVTEGEQVSFSVVPLRPGEGIHGRVAGDTGSSQKDDGTLTPVAATDAEGVSLGSPQRESREPSNAASQHHVAMDLRYYDAKTGKEASISPLTLYGKVVEWNAAEGLGMIAELDTRRQYHEDAPHFPFSSENMDLSFGTEMRTGRYVRFCLEPASSPHTDGGEDTAAAATPTVAADGDAAAAADVTAPTGSNDVELVAQRVIVDSTMERRKGAIGRPLVPANAAPGTMTSESRFSGVVRDMRGDNFGFIQDDLSGESVFFHLSNAFVKVKAGDRVTYLLREIEYGKHAGKKACYDVLVDQTAKNRSPGELRGLRAAPDDGDVSGGRQAHTTQRRSRKTHDEDDLDFDLLD